MPTNELKIGTPILAAPWNDGALPMPLFVAHAYGGREDTGLCVTLCGVRQEDRGNGWVLSTNRSVECADCLELAAYNAEH